MKFIIEPKQGYTIKSIVNLLKEIGVPFELKENFICADLTFGQAADLKDKAYCTYKI